MKFSFLFASASELHNWRRRGRGSWTGSRNPQSQWRLSGNHGSRSWAGGLDQHYRSYRRQQCWQQLLPWLAAEGNVPSQKCLKGDLGWESWVAPSTFEGYSDRFLELCCTEPLRPCCLFNHKRVLVHRLRWNDLQEVGRPERASFVYPGAGECWIHPHAWQPLSSEHSIFRAWEGDSSLPETSRTQSGLWGTRWIKQPQNRALGNVIKVNAWLKALGDHKRQCLNYGESWEEAVG